jgi:hypothetical protein
MEGESCIRGIAAALRIRFWVAIAGLPLICLMRAVPQGPLSPAIMKQSYAFEACLRNPSRPRGANAVQGSRQPDQQNAPSRLPLRGKSERDPKVDVIAQRAEKSFGRLQVVFDRDRAAGLKLSQHVCQALADRWSGMNLLSLGA